MALEFTPFDIARHAGTIRHLNQAAALILSGSSMPDRIERENMVMAILGVAEALALRVEDVAEAAGQIEAATSADMLHWRRQEASGASAAASRMQPDRTPTMGFVPKPPAGPPAAAS